MTAENPQSWRLAWIAILAGLVAAFHMGKVPTALPFLSDELSLTLWQSGLIVSSFSIIAAIFGLAMGLVSAHIGLVAAGIAGLVLTAAGAMLGTQAARFDLLLVTRIIEGLGFVLVAVTMPGVISRVCPPRQRALALGIWGAFIPAAMSMMLFIAPAFLENGNWQSLWWTTGLICATWAVVFGITFSSRQQLDVKQHRNMDALRVVARGRPLLVALVFICYSALFAAMTGFLPTLWSEVKQIDVALASRLGAIAVAGNIVGNVFAGWLYGRGVALKRLLYLAIVGGSGSATLVFVTDLPLWIQFFGMLGFATLSGILPGAVFASAPDIAADPKQISLVIGLVFQGAGIGQVGGPLLLSAVVSISGNWSGGIFFTLFIAVAGALLIRHVGEPQRQ